MTSLDANSINKSSLALFRKNTMSHSPLTPFKTRLLARKDELKQLGSSFLELGKQYGYSENQIYAVTRRHTFPTYGLQFEIAKRLGLINEVYNSEAKVVNQSCKPE